MAHSDHTRGEGVSSANYVALRHDGVAPECDTDGCDITDGRVALATYRHGSAGPDAAGTSDTPTVVGGSHLGDASGTSFRECDVSGLDATGGVLPPVTQAHVGAGGTGGETGGQEATRTAPHSDSDHAHRGGRGTLDSPPDQVASWIESNHANKADWMRVDYINKPGPKGDRHVFSIKLVEHQSGCTAAVQIYDRCVRGVCTCTHLIAGGNAQLLPCRMFCELFLRGDTDPDWEYLLRGATFGFRVINPSCDLSYDSRHHRVRDPVNHALITSKLQKEITQGCIRVVEDRPSCVHDIFCVPKDDGGVRSIVDCSQPEGNSVNGYTTEVAVKFSYNSVDDVADCMERGDHLATVDIKDAYRAVCIHPADRDRQGLHWDFDNTEVPHCTYLEDNRLCMGLSSSPYVFSKISDLIVRCAVREGVERVVNYLDDFCLISATYEEGCDHQCTLLAIIRRLGFYGSFGKVVSPQHVGQVPGYQDRHCSPGNEPPAGQARPPHRDPGRYQGPTQGDQEGP